jgi:hypothetical protein
MTLRMSRRRFVLSMAAALAPLSLVGFAWTRFPALRRTALEGLLSDIAGARVIGLRYLAMAPEEADRALLAAELFSGYSDAPSNPIEFDRLRQTLAARRERDFAAGDTVVIGGWILARSEARLCALATLA